MIRKETNELVETPWLPVVKFFDATTLELTLRPSLLITHSRSCFPVGIRYGSTMAAKMIKQVSYAGSAKVARAV